MLRIVTNKLTSAIRCKVRKAALPTIVCCCCCHQCCIALWVIYASMAYPWCHTLKETYRLLSLSKYDVSWILDNSEFFLFFSKFEQSQNSDVELKVGLNLVAAFFEENTRRRLNSHCKVWTEIKFSQRAKPYWCMWSIFWIFTYQTFQVALWTSRWWLISDTFTVVH